MQNVFIVVLKQHFFVDVIEWINFKNKFSRAIKMTKYWNESNRVFQLFKGFLTRFKSLKHRIFLNELQYESNNFRKFFNKASIEVAETYEFLNFFKVNWWLLIYDNFHFLEIHTNVFNKYYDFKKRNLLNVKAVFWNVNLKARVNQFL